jgi:diguanylate cyclase (GGDEF)-like protein
MKAAAAARTWWAALRQRVRAAAPAPAAARPSAPTAALRAAASHVSSYVLMGLAVVMLACAAAGFVVTLHEDHRLAAERHAALALALDEVHGAFGDSNHFDDTKLPIIARLAGLKDLRFDSDETGGGREVQSVLSDGGRIVGWLSWAPDRTLIRAMYWLWSLTGVFGVALGICAFRAAGLIQRLARLLAVNLRTIRKLTSEDALTGLPNHRVMLEMLDQALTQRSLGVVVLALIDLDGFREVNDTHGRVGGDALLKSIAERLQAGLPPGAQFGRFDDDEFAVIMASDDIQAASALAESLRASLVRPIFMEQNWQISAGIGIAQAPADGKTAEELSRRADLALRAAKRDGRGTLQRFEPYIEMEHSEQRFIRRELESALAANALHVHYQPVVAAAGGGMLGVEALLRWTHPSRGAIAPSVFIPLAEKSGLMLQLGEFVLRRALADGARWPNLTVAVNLSPVQIRDPKLIDLVSAVIAESGIAPSRIIFEITEGVLIDDPQETLQRLEALRRLGVSLALDDFGTGYSSLSYLQRFPFSVIKIDRAFVTSLGNTGHAGAIIQSIVALGHALGMKVLAEGVETDEQRVLLRLAGCDEMQGFLFAKPRPAESIDKVLARPAGSRADGKPALVAAAAS